MRNVYRILKEIISGTGRDGWVRKKFICKEYYFERKMETKFTSSYV